VRGEKKEVSGGGENRGNSKEHNGNLTEVDVTENGKPLGKRDRKGPFPIFVKIGKKGGLGTLKGTSKDCFHTTFGTVRGSGY